MPNYLNPSTNHGGSKVVVVDTNAASQHATGNVTPAGLWRRNSAWPIWNADWRQLSFNEEVYNSGGIERVLNGLFACRESGLWAITSSAAFRTNSDGRLRAMRLMVNGERVVGDRRAPVTGYQTVVSVSAYWPLYEEDEIEIEMYQNSGVDLEVWDTNTDAIIHFAKLGEI